MIEKLQQLAAQAAVLFQQYQALEAERNRLSDLGHESEDVAVVRDVAAKLRDLAGQFGHLMDQGTPIETAADQAYAAAQELIDTLREQSVDVASDIYSEADSSGDACNDDADSFEVWVDEQEAAPEQLSRRSRPRFQFQVG